MSPFRLLQHDMVWTAEVHYPGAEHYSSSNPSRPTLASNQPFVQWLLLILHERSMSMMGLAPKLKGDWIRVFTSPNGFTVWCLTVHRKYFYSTALSCDTPEVPQQWVLNPASYFRCHVSNFGSETGWLSFYKGFSLSLQLWWDSTEIRFTMPSSHIPSSLLLIILPILLHCIIWDVNTVIKF